MMDIQGVVVSLEAVTQTVADGTTEPCTATDIIFYCIASVGVGLLVGPTIVCQSSAYGGHYRHMQAINNFNIEIGVFTGKRRTGRVQK